MKLHSNVQNHPVPVLKDLKSERCEWSPFLLITCNQNQRNHKKLRAYCSKLIILIKLINIYLCINLIWPLLR